MFATYEPFKFPLQFDNESTIWRGIEIMLNTPWLLAAAFDDVEGVPRTFLLQGTFDLLQFLESPVIGRLTGVRLVLPPDLSPTCDWTFVPIWRIERELRSSDGAIPSVVLTARDGRRYGGFPIAPTQRDDADLAPLVELPMSAT
jgi:hypothetical protein